MLQNQAKATKIQNLWEDLWHRNISWAFTRNAKNPNVATLSVRSLLSMTMATLHHTNDVTSFCHQQFCISRPIENLKPTKTKTSISTTSFYDMHACFNASKIQTEQRNWHSIKMLARKKKRNSLCESDQQDHVTSCY